jgi:glycosyltransferase involved in cell wall biosynthesis
VATRLLGPSLRRWDQRAARRADTYVVNSTFTRDLVREVYDIDAEVVFPPVAAPATFTPDEPVDDVVVVARLLPYKNVDVVLDVAALMPGRTFRIVGDGPLRDELHARATPNVTFVGTVDDDALWREYRRSRVHLALSHEDFGITPLEAAAAGRPTVARRYGGYLDTITENTGVLVDETTLDAHSVREVLEAALSRSWDETQLHAHAASFAPSAHLERLGQIIEVAPTLS